MKPCTRGSDDLVRGSLSRASFAAYWSSRLVPQLVTLDVVEISQPIRPKMNLQQLTK